MYSYWNQLLEITLFERMQGFYNKNIQITDNNGYQKTESQSFNDLFDQKKFKRIIISEPAGYWKSTFVHEMVRQWIEGW